MGGEKCFRIMGHLTGALLSCGFFLFDCHLSAIPPVSSCVADKPHSSYSQRLTHAAYASLSARTAAKFEERKHLNNGLLHTSRAPCSVGGGGPSTSRMAGSEIMSPWKAEVVQAFAAEVAARRAVAEAARPDSQILHMDSAASSLTDNGWLRASSRAVIYTTLAYIELWRLFRASV